MGCKVVKRHKKAANMTVAGAARSLVNAVSVRKSGYVKKGNQRTKEETKRILTLLFVLYYLFPLLDINHKYMIIMLNSIIKTKWGDGNETPFYCFLGCFFDDSACNVAFLTAKIRPCHW